MKIKFVNHASFILEHGQTKLICDPWLEGTAFDNGWKLLSPTLFRYEDFNEITHIWFSHEHPDHFSPPNLLNIPLEYRRKISVLYQKTIDEKVAEFCKKLDFKDIIELKPNTYHNIDPGLKVLCNPYTEGDSYILFKTDEITILNLNDCIVDSREKARDLARITGEVDVLLTQFGYANKIGNINEKHKREAASKEKLARIRSQYEFLKPEFIIPFASFIYFCHEENSYMNEGMNKIDKVYAFITNDLQTGCVVLYPNDTWDLRSPHNSSDAIKKYRQDTDRINAEPLIKSEKIEMNKVIEEGMAFVSDLKQNNPKIKNKIELLDSNIFLTDYSQTFVLSGNKGLVQKPLEYNSCDIALSSQALYYTFKHKWGGDTLNVNARFQVPESGNYSKFRMYTYIANNRGETKEFPGLIERGKHKLKRLFTRD